MALKTYDEQLASVQDAISRIEAGAQSVMINGRGVTRADLRTLYEREAWLRRMVDRAARGGIRLRQARPLG